MTSPKEQHTETSAAILQFQPDITIRPFQPLDAPSLSRQGNDRRVWDFLRDRMPLPYTRAAATDFIAHCTSSSAHQASGPYDDATRTSSGPRVPTQFAIVVSGKAVGVIGLDFGEGNQRRSAALGYWLGADFWGRGIMGRVAPAFVAWAWRTWDVLLRLDSGAYAHNGASRRVLAKAEFVEEGVRKGYLVKNGVLVDEVQLGLLRPGLEHGS